MSEHFNLFFKELNLRKNMKASINLKEKEDYSADFKLL